jgi:modulator of FtsH protease
MDATLLDGWADFGVASAGATAALTGLVVVAISVNLKEILAFPTIVPRAGSTIAGLVVAVLASLGFLVPGQTLLAFGIEVLIPWTVAAFFDMRSLIAHRRSDRPATEIIGQAVLSAIQYLPLLVGGILMIAGMPFGVTLVAIGIATTIIASMVNTWVLLVEILR